ncbi:MAG: hypothetical protein JKY22_06150 [Flavobacteriaceae bacterium]|nr:hypothetical protein [Flavobacteriaceae bacterium]
MKKTIFFLSLFVAISCNKDDTTSSLTIAIDSIESFQATISWSFQGANGQTLYKLVLENEVLEEAFSGNQYTFNYLQNNTSYSGVVFAISQNGDETFQEFSFRTTTLGQQNQDPTVWRGTAVLNTQAEVDAFDFRVVTGALWIYSANVTDLSNLSSLESVGSIRIDDTSLQSLNGLHNLVNVEDPEGRFILEIRRNNSLSDIAALQNVSNFATTLNVFGNNSLSNLVDLGIAPSADLIHISNCDTENFDFLSNLETLENLILKDIGNLNAHGLSGFANLTSLNRFDIKNVRGIQDLLGFGNLTSIATNGLVIKDCPDLISLDGLENLISINDDAIQLENLESLQSISALSNLTGNLSMIRLINLNSLTSLEGLNGIESTRGAVQLNHLNSLTNLQGLNSLREALGGFALNNMDNFITTDGLDSFETVATGYDYFHLIPSGYFGLFNLPKFNSFQGLNNLSFIGELYIINCPSLANLDGLENVHESFDFGAWITIGDNTLLSDFCGLTLWANSVNRGGGYGTFNNAYNPTWFQIGSSSQCSQ